MALIPAYQINAPSTRACNVDSPVFGGTIAQMIDLTNHLALGRARRCVHANFTRLTPKDFADLDGNTDTIEIDAEAPESSETLEIPWLSSPMARYVVLFIRYRATGSPSIAADLYELNTTGGAHTRIDVGCSWSATNGRLQSTDYPQGGAIRYGLLEATTTAQIRDASGGVDDPRPLVIPSASRGLELMVRLDCVQTSITSVDVFELYEEQWS
jgi:hypothetical protein